MQRPRNIVILTGAGISAESGVPTFRGPDGLWEGQRVEEGLAPVGVAGAHLLQMLREEALIPTAVRAVSGVQQQLDASGIPVRESGSASRWAS